MPQAARILRGANLLPLRASGHHGAHLSHLPGGMARAGPLYRRTRTRGTGPTPETRPTATQASKRKRAATGLALNTGTFVLFAVAFRLVDLLFSMSFFLWDS